MQINQAGLDIIKRNEGCRLKAYQDVVGIWTIGYGHTPATKNQIITQEEANELLAKDLFLFETMVAHAVSDHPTTANQYSAMVSLAYNIGIGHFRASTVLRDHLAGDYKNAADAFLMWDKAGGQVFTGLQRRRQEERQLYLTP